MTYPLVADLAVEGVRVSTSCRVLGFSPQAFYKWRNRPCSDRDRSDAELVNALFDIHHDDPEFGYRFIADESEHTGRRVSENWVQRLCQEHRIWSTTMKKRGVSRAAGPPVHDDLVDRDFTASRPNERWVGDITEHRTRAGKLYLCTVKDLSPLTNSSPRREIRSRNTCERTDDTAVTVPAANPVTWRAREQMIDSSGDNPLRYVR